MTLILCHSICLLVFWAVDLQTVTTSHIIFQELVIGAAQPPVKMEVVLGHLDYSEKKWQACS